MPPRPSLPALNQPVAPALLLGLPLLMNVSEATSKVAVSAPATLDQTKIAAKTAQKSRYNLNFVMWNLVFIIDSPSLPIIEPDLANNVNFLEKIIFLLNVNKSLKIYINQNKF